METVENLPKRVVQPYRSMTIEQLIECDDVLPEDLVGAEAVHKHLKIYKSLFKTFLTESKDILSKSPTDGIVAAPSKARFGAYSAAEMKKFVGWALSSLMDGRSGSLCCWRTQGPEEVRLLNWRSRRSNLMRIASGSTPDRGRKAG